MLAKPPGWLVIKAVLAFALTLLAVPSNATSIIIALENGRIILLADSRASELNPLGRTIRDDKCKIVILGERFAFAETGREGYTRTTPTDSVPGWHGTSEALKAYNNVFDHDLHAVALSWGIQVTNYFQVFFLADPQRVRSLTNQETLNGTLLVGIFAGADRSGLLKVYKVRIALDDSLHLREPAAQTPIGYAIDEIPPRDEPYSTEAVTQELLDGKTQRARDVANAWAKKSRHFPKSDRKLRRLEFLIEQTSNYDEEVHGPANTLQLTRDSATWLQNNTCQGSIE
jgi:hypothetical protein